MATTSPIENMQRKLRESSKACRLVPMNEMAVRSHGRVVFSAAKDLLGYQNYRVAASKWKATNKGSTTAFESAVLSQSEMALHRSAELGRSALSVLEQTNSTGLLDEVHGRIAASAKGGGPMEVRELWEQVRSNAAFTAHLAELGLDKELLDMFDSHVKQVSATVVERDGHLVLRGQPRGSATVQELVMGTTSRTRPRNAGELLQRGSLAAYMRNAASGSMAGLPVVRIGGGPVPVDLLAAAGIAAAHHKVAAHKRKIEDTGLATHAGDEPGSLIFIIGAILIIAGAIGAAATCIEDSPLHDETACVISQIALLVGLTMVGMGAIHDAWALGITTAAGIGITAGFVVGVVIEELLILALNRVPGPEE